MRKPWLNFLFAGIAIGLLVLAGCSDSNDTTGPGPGSTTNPLIGTWDADSVNAAILGEDDITYFLHADTTYLWYQRAGATEIRESGTWHSTPDSIYFHATLQDTLVINSRYALWYDLSTNNDTLRVRYLFPPDPHLYTVAFTRH
jgi:hypothetical protein